MTKFEDLPMRGRTCLVTGTTGGLGKQIALGLAKRGATVLMVARDRERGEAAAAELRAAAPHGTLEPLFADLAAQADVRALAKEVTARHERLDVLVHNAAVAHATRRTTADGIEATLAVNHLAPFLLTHLLLGPLLAAPAPRVVTTSSYLHTMVNRVPWDDLQGERGYRGQSVYNLTKLMNVLFTVELARQHEHTRLTANALHPGWPLKTDLGREQRGIGAAFDWFTKLFGASATKGAGTALFLATSPAVATVTGTYFAKNAPAKSSSLARDPAAAERLWRASTELCGLASR